MMKAKPGRLSRRIYIVEDKPGGRVLLTRHVDGLREQQIHTLECRLRADYGVDRADSGVVLRDSANDREA